MSMELTYKLVNDVYGPTDIRGYIVRRIEAYKGSVRVGYLTFTRLDSEVHWRNLPDSLSFMEECKGWCISEEEPQRSQDALRYLRRVLPSAQSESVEVAYAQFFEKQRKDYLDKADSTYVEYIKVEPQYQRNGIGTLLYAEVARFLAKEGRELRASGIQSPEAKAAWRALPSKLPHGFVHTKKKVGDKVYSHVRAE